MTKTSLLAKVEKLFFDLFKKNNRFTQDSPVYPDVWLEYFRRSTGNAHERIDLILTPHRESSAPELFRLLDERLRKHHTPTAKDKTPNWLLACTGETVVARLSLSELIEVALPYTKWWQEYMWEKADEKIPREDQRWLREITGAILWCSSAAAKTGRKLPNSFAANFNKRYTIPPKAQVNKNRLPQALWSVSRNRPAEICIDKSVATTKADAGRRTFDITGRGIVWAVLDTGIDARHVAFRKLKNAREGLFYEEPMGAKEDPDSNFTRIIATYDFTRFRKVVGELTGSNSKPSAKYKNRSLLKNLVAVTSNNADASLDDETIAESADEIFAALKRGRMFDWGVILPLLRIPHNKEQYVLPQQDHGTHVAGIIAANPFTGAGRNKYVGMCPDIQLYDIRVLDETGRGDEFNILAALQFIRWFNNRKESITIHGINLSLSMKHEVANYACGQTPVCEACNRLVAEGTIVVAAAGNEGQTMYRSKDGLEQEGFRTVNITDPGNADGVITVGATHCNRPHTYGVSYFSSKGPTGDGRIKPDLVAPGEKIESTVLADRYDRKDGTSMAAPHVSGAAALLLDKYRELIGHTGRVKRILCSTATDLGREKYFQGAGMLDVMRALQSV